MQFRDIQQLLPIVAWLVIVTGISYLIQFSLRNKQRGGVSLLTRNLLRCPGESLRQRLEAVAANLNFSVVQLLFLPIFLYIIYILPSADQVLGLDSSLLMAGGLFGLGFLGFFLFRTQKLLREQRQLHMELDCQAAVGQELNHLMQRGCFVYHDFPGEKFNISHILVSPAGVYAVDTLARAKPNKGRGEADARVFYDGVTINFPDWTETKPVEQVRVKAKWLAEWLESVVGETVEVKPVIFLPSWFIRSERRHEVSLINEKHTKFLINPREEKGLSEEISRRIACQIEQRCRLVEPVEHQKSEKCIEKQV